MRVIFVDMCSFHSFPFAGAKLITLYTYNAICLKPFLLLMNVCSPPMLSSTNNAPMNSQAGASLCESVCGVHTSQMRLWF